MKSKKINFVKNIIIILAIIMLCGTNAVYAWGGTSTNDGTSFIRSLINRIFKLGQEKGEYTLEDFQLDLQNMEISGKYDINSIIESYNKLPEGEDKETLLPTMDMFSNILNTSENTNIDITSLLKKLVDMLINAVKSLLGGSSSSLPVEAQTIEMNAKTAVEFAGNDYEAKLVAKVYQHVDAEGKADSNKWALLIHPNSMSGEKIAAQVGPFYYEKGYNIFAPDLRGAGDSEGKVSLGFLDSLDVYDWLTILNEDYNPESVIIHGISLGGATTNYLSGIDKFMSNGPTKISALKPINELKVIGLVEDCGYTDMEVFASKSSLISMGIGLTESNFDYYSKATNSLKYCELPMLIIHGTEDIIVKPENAETVKNTVKGYTEEWLVEGKNHAFIIMGQSTDEYRTHVQNFIDKCEGNEVKSEVIQDTNQKTEETNTEKEQSSSGFLSKLLEKLKFYQK